MKGSLEIITNLYKPVSLDRPIHSDCQVILRLGSGLMAIDRLALDYLEPVYYGHKPVSLDRPLYSGCQDDLEAVRR